MAEVYQIPPSFLLKCIDFKTSSGNVVTRVNLLGDAGISIGWKHPPTDQDSNELRHFFETQAGEELDFTGGYTGPASTGGHERAQRAYNEWRKKVGGEK